MFSSPSVNASVTFDLFSFALLFCKPFSASSFQTFPCLVILFVVDNAYGIFAFFKTFHGQVFARVFLFCFSRMYFLTGLSNALNLLELSAHSRCKNLHHSPVLKTKQNKTLKTPTLTIARKKENFRGFTPR